MWLKKKIDEILKGTTKVADDADKKAKAAEAKASQTSDHIEKEKYKTEAKIWKEVAEKLKAENECLKTKLENVICESENKINSKFENMKIDLTSKDKRIQIDDQSFELPKLPSAEDK